MERVFVNRDSEIRLFHPDWWHTHGIKMRLREDETTLDRIVIRGSAAELIITNSQLLDLKTRLMEDKKWVVDWKVVKSPIEYTKGRLLWGIDTLKTAFDFDQSTDQWSVWLIQRYGGTVACQGAFIRWKNYLNIPGPGTGHDGDPNVSLEIDKPIKNAIYNLIYSTLSPEESRHWTVHEACKEYFGDLGVIRPTNVDDYPR